MQWSPSSIHGSPKTVPCGKASRVPVPIRRKRYGPGRCAVTAADSLTQRAPRCTARDTARRRQAATDENTFLFIGTRTR
ncbi:hypothetical protein GCM10012285_08220 [Streptomyces kronopolitis]|uniref:Uncharacterized protein n=1 Tax=Streptomyces kronopolitis TaxID=1612435 RepID=A0ABQ2J2V9_9ACTN|nr:hypothetical protein GCM10012285_08220 [Streptomyces kronopolitis]